MKSGIGGSYPPMVPSTSASTSLLSSNGGNRKMRRTRDASAPTTTTSTTSSVDGINNNTDGLVVSIMNGYDLYNIHGDALEALKVFQHSQQQSKLLMSKDNDDSSNINTNNNNKSDSTTGVSIASKYNCMMLSQIASNKKKKTNNSTTTTTAGAAAAADTTTSSSSSSWKTTFMNKLDEIEARYYLLEQEKGATTSNSSNNSNPLISTSSAIKKRRNEYILSYNRMLGLFGSGNIQQCALIFSKKLTNPIDKYQIFKTRKNASSTTTTSTSTNGSTNTIVTKQDPNFPTEVAVVAVNMSFLIFECVLCMAVGRHNGLHDIASSIGIPPVDDIVDWLESLPVINSGSQTTTGTTTTGGIDNNNNNNYNTSKVMQQIRFLFNLYKSRLALANLHTETATHVDANIRSARKDMKTAMEIFQHKLRPTFTSTNYNNNNNNSSNNTIETGSVVSSANSEENLSMAGGSNHHHNNTKQQQTKDTSDSTTTTGSNSNNIVLQKLNQSALGLKAHLEQLKGNTKKSLILCSEAVSSVENNDSTTSTAAAAGTSNTFYDAIHSNNLAVIYETNERRQLALHALTKSLRASSADMGGSSSSASALAASASVRSGTNDNDNDDKNNNSIDNTESSVPLFYRDGTVRPNFMTSLAILHNAAICALSARNYISAYECFATCVTRCDIFAKRPTIWLRMSEACFGIYSTIKNAAGTSSRSTLVPSRQCIKALQVDGENKGILLDDSTFGEGEAPIMEEVELVLASPEDMVQVKRNPLLRARVCIELALQYESKLNTLQLVSSRLGLSYIFLTFEYYQEALDMCQLVFTTPNPVLTKDDTITARLYRRQIATARLYAAEAACALGQPRAALVFLTVKNTSSASDDTDTINEFALSLSGMSIESISKKEKAKRQYEKACTIEQSLAFALASDDIDSNDVQAMKQLANKVQAEEDWNSMHNDKSSACLALVYSMLRAGEQSSALALLKSMRSL